MRDLLYSMGLSRRYRGVAYVLEALEITAREEDALSAVVKDIYMVLAAKAGCTWSTVERDIRTVVKRAWVVNPEKLAEIAGYPLPGPPTSAEFLDILTTYAQRHGVNVP